VRLWSTVRRLHRYLPFVDLPMLFMREPELLGRGSHSSTLQLNLSRFGHTSPCLSPCLIDWGKSCTQCIPQNVHPLSRQVDECKPLLLGVGAEDVVARTVRLKAALPFIDARSLHLAPGLLMWEDPRELAAAAEALISRSATGAGSRVLHSFPDYLLILYHCTTVPLYHCTRVHARTRH